MHICDRYRGKKFPATRHRFRGVKWTLRIGVRLVGNVSIRSRLDPVSVVFMLIEIKERRT